ncbi:MAG: type-F conjugative transfer system pilin assembly protein TrbC [Rhodoferax sp.]|uniref:type-F conjugative transfer system pilin assembly protein TrbC n=1 Tax=Rhodoferax sp. TaxID=50421 RepID=UPI002627FED9|nr:type-F conjugative transfer system pilin assembly protein TrbC [Rhodoferax sp.]MDD5332878.1 type-F conjugative transfer system pilin assembly protein TrbC [Rhodoferax sp.]
MASDPFIRPFMRISLALTVLLLSSAAGMGTAWAQSVPVITEADLERARREQPNITDQDLERARQKYRAPTEAELSAAPVPVQPNIDSLPQPQTNALIDLEALAKGYSAQSDAMAQAQGLATGPGLFVFISLSMPQATLRRLVDQAARAQASVFIRGLAGGSLRTTVAQVQGLIGQRQVAVQIDPQAFDRFDIERVPSFVLVRDGTRPVSCASGLCAPPEGFLRTTGDVSLDYALEYMQRGSPQFAKDASGFLRRIKGQGN